MARPKAVGGHWTDGAGRSQRLAWVQVSNLTLTVASKGTRCVRPFRQIFSRSALWDDHWRRHGSHRSREQQQGRDDLHGWGSYD